MHLLQHEQRAIEQPEHLRVDLGRVARRGREELVQHGHAHTLGEELLRGRGHARADTAFPLRTYRSTQRTFLVYLGVDEYVDEGLDHVGVAT